MEILEVLKATTKYPSTVPTKMTKKIQKIRVTLWRPPLSPSAWRDEKNQCPLVPGVTELVIAVE